MKVQGFKGFLVVWFGQLCSIFGSALTRFAITIWIYQETGSATVLTTAGFFAIAPALVLMPLGGVLADRLSRKKIMIWTDMLGGISTVFMLVFLSTGKLQVWHIYIANALLATSEGFQYPAYLAATALLVPKENFSRANGMRDLAGSASRNFAPLIAAALLPLINVKGIMLIDLISFGFAVLTIGGVWIPQPEKSIEGTASQSSLLKDITFGFRFIWKRPSLLGLQSFFLLLNFFYTMSSMLIPAIRNIEDILPDNFAAVSSHYPGKTVKSGEKILKPKQATVD